MHYGNGDKPNGFHPKALIFLCDTFCWLEQNQAEKATNTY